MIFNYLTFLDVSLIIDLPILHTILIGSYEDFFVSLSITTNQKSESIYHVEVSFFSLHSYVFFGKKS